MFAARGLSMPEREPRVTDLRLLTTGPCRLTQALGITRARDNGKDLTTFSDLTILDDGSRAGRVVTTPRMGITKATGEKLRYVIDGNPFVSGKSMEVRTKK